LNFENPIVEEGQQYSYSNDNGNNFFTPKLLAPLFFSSGPAISISSQNTYAAWSQGDTRQSAIFFSRSLDGGVTFSPPVRISGVAHTSFNPYMRLDSTGNIYIVWAAGSALAKNIKILFSKSTDQGISFSSPITLSTSAPNSFCPSIALGDGGQIYITWTSSDGGYQYASKTYLSASVDNGNTFSVPLKIPFMSEYVACPTIVAGKSNQINLIWNDYPSKIKTDLERWDIYYSKGTVSIP
jgi:hypothetical protein